MNKWVFKNIFDYWDQNQDAVYRCSTEIAGLDESKQAEAFDLISQSMTIHADNLNDKELLMAAFSMSEDLYKAANRAPTLFDETVQQYLTSSAGVFCKALMKRGFVIHYIIDNEFEKTFDGMVRPLDLYQGWFQAAGLIYVCPQSIALEIMTQDRHERSEYFNLLPAFADEARDVANDVLDQCHSKRLHYVFLDTDSNPDSFQKAFNADSQPGVLTIFRNEPPIEGSKSSANFPDKIITNGKAI